MSCTVLSVCRLVNLFVSNMTSTFVDKHVPSSLHLPCVQHSTQADDNSIQLESPFLGDNAVSTDDDGVKKSHNGKSCEDDEDGHLVYHNGLVLKDRCI